MNDDAIRTRFAPSPTGALHVGNARTALFNWLFARHYGGQFILRSEDTDIEREEQGALEHQQEMLRWLGLDWDEGPDIGGRCAPYRQSERASRYREALERLRAQDHVYPCYCTREELAEARRRQLAAGRAPRYPGTCAALDAEERREREKSGRIPAWRFRIPGSGTVEFDDLVHGRQRFSVADHGDFVLARADGTPSFLFANALDDADMAISHVLRGDDHLANTPRQILLLRALELPVPQYGHFGLVTGSDGKPLSKRDRAADLRDLREQGVLAIALFNHLVRIGCPGLPEDLLDRSALADAFDPGRISRGPAAFDVSALEHWQREALDTLSAAEVREWMGAGPEVAATLGSDGGLEAAAEAIRPNVLYRHEARRWLEQLFGGTFRVETEAIEVLREAGADFFRAATGVAVPKADEDFASWARAVGQATDRRGRALFLPLRAALTGAISGPELAAVVPLMGAERIRVRLDEAARIAQETGN